VIKLLIGIVGKPSSGKTTFLNAACLTSYKVADYPFTTIEPQPGTAFVRVKCVCKEFDVKCNPKVGYCVNGVRYVPVHMLDVAGLVPDAWMGRGLGNKFLDDLRTADALIHVVDASGSTDAEGRKVPPGSWDPVKDVEFLEREIAMWIVQILKRDWRRLVGKARSLRVKPEDVLFERLSGLKISKTDIASALKASGLEGKKLDTWNDDDLYNFVKVLREISKPMIIAANKIDLPYAEENLKRLIEVFKGRYEVVPCCAAGEYALRQLAQRGIISYNPGDCDFEILKPEKLSKDALDRLERLRSQVLKKYGSTGVQMVLEKVVFELLDLIPVFPVEDPKRLTDHHGNVLPDVFLVPRGSTARDLAYMIHTELGDTFLYAIDVRTGMRLGEDEELKERAVVKIVATAARR